jgi:hypothetical protein
MTKNEDQVALKVEQLRGSQHSSSGGKEQPSKSVWKKTWFEMAMQDAQEQEASRSIIKGNCLKQGPSKMAGRASVSKGAANREDWRVALVADRIMKMESLPVSGSTFLAKRECWFL